MYPPEAASEAKVARAAWRVVVAGGVVAVVAATAMGRGGARACRLPGIGRPPILRPRLDAYARSAAMAAERHQAAQRS